MYKAFKFRMYPTIEQEKIINMNLDNKRFIYNYYLDKAKNSNQVNTKQNIYDYNKKLKLSNQFLQTLDMNIVYKALYSIEETYKKINNLETIKFKSKYSRNSYTALFNKNINEIDINTGAGKVDIEKLKANKLKLDLGAGSTNIKYIETNNADIETGAGKFTIEDGILNDLDFDIGAGEANVNARLLGDSKIEVGVGSLNLNLLGSRELYKLKLEKGIGVVRVDGSLIENDSTVGNGNNYIRIEGGIGSIKVNYER